jgi:hypothetical protein
MTIKDLDELAYGASAPEKISHLGVLILKTDQHVKVLRCVFEIFVDFVPKKYEHHAAEGKRTFGILAGLFDKMLKLTSQKTAIQFTDNYIKKQKIGEQKIANAVSLAAGNKIVEETPLDRLLSLNLKMTKSDSISNRVKKRRKRKPAAVLVSPSKTSFPYIVDSSTHTTFHLGRTKTFGFQILSAWILSSIH